MNKTSKNRLRLMTQRQLLERLSYLKSKRIGLSKSNAMKHIEYQLKKRFGKGEVL